MSSSSSNQPTHFYSLDAGIKVPLPALEQQRLLRWRLSTFWVMLIGYIGYYICRGNLSAALPLLEQEFGYSNVQLALIGTFSELTYAAGKFINGPLADRIGGRRIFLIGMAGAIFWNIVFSLSASLSVFIVVWCFCRYFLAMGWGGLAKTIGNWYPTEQNGTVMGFVSINFQFGGVIATLFAFFLVDQVGVSWQGVFLYPAAVLGVIFIWSYFSCRSGPEDVVPGAKVESRNEEEQLADYGSDEDQPPVSTVIKTLLQLSIYRKLLLFSFLTTMLRAVFLFWTPIFLYDIGQEASQSILKSAVFPALGVAGTVFIGWFTDNYAVNGDRAKMMWLMLVGLVVSLLAIGFLITADEINQNLVLVFLGASGFFLLGPYSMSSGCLTLDIAGSKGAGSCTGLIDGVGYIGSSLATFAAGYISEYMGWSQVFFLLAGFAFVAVLCAQAMSREFQGIAAAKNATA